MHVREIGTMWQVGVLIGKLCTFVIFGVLALTKKGETFEVGPFGRKNGTFLLLVLQKVVFYWNS